MCAGGNADEKNPTQISAYLKRLSDWATGRYDRSDDSTVPDSKWWDGTTSNLEIFDITAPGAEVSFNARLFQVDTVVESVFGESTADLDIPDNSAAGITDTITIDKEMTIGGVEVTLDISHTYRGDLVVTLTAPGGDAIVLHHRHKPLCSKNHPGFIFLITLRWEFNEISLPTLQEMSTSGVRSGRPGFRKAEQLAGRHSIRALT